jgi:hypothetical protein
MYHGGVDVDLAKHADPSIAILSLIFQIGTIVGIGL